MGYMSQPGSVGFKTQATKGTFLPPGATAPNQGVFMFFNSGALGGKRTLMIPNPEIGGSRHLPDAQLGPISYAGEYDFNVRMEMLGTLVQGALGVAASSGSALLGYTHTIAAADVSPWLSIEENIGGEVTTGLPIISMAYTDAKINTLHLEAAADGYLTGKAGVMAIKGSEIKVGATAPIPTAPTPVASQRIDGSGLSVGSNVCIRWGATVGTVTDLPAKSFSFDVNNNIDDADYRLCTMGIGDLVAMRREVTAGAKIRPDDAALWKTALWGSPTAVTPLGTSYKGACVIDVTSFEKITGATSATYHLAITIPKAVIEPFTFAPSGDSILENDIVIRAVRPQLTTAICTVVLNNSFATVA